MTAPQFKASCPGKVFIVGEYSVMVGGPCLVGTVGPLFSLNATQSSSTMALPFAAQSPAGLYLQKYSSLLKGWQLTWHDPYDTPIGVGSSSAQFILSVALVAQLQKKPLPTAQDVLSLYFQTVGTSQGLRPSGADVVAQWEGGPLIVRNEPFSSEVLLSWRGGGEFLLAFTGSKAKTHEHLQSLVTRGFPGRFTEMFFELDKISLDAVNAWKKSDSENLGRLLNCYQEVLNRWELTPLEFAERIGNVQKWPGVWGAKGSGAQGGDCVLMIVDPRQRNTLEARLQQELGWIPYSVNGAPRGVHVDL